MSEILLQMQGSWQLIPDPRRPASGDTERLVTQPRHYKRYDTRQLVQLMSGDEDRRPTPTEVTVWQIRRCSVVKCLKCYVLCFRHKALRSGLTPNSMRPTPGTKEGILVIIALTWRKLRPESTRTVKDYVHISTSVTTWLRAK